MSLGDDSLNRVGSVENDLSFIVPLRQGQGRARGTCRYKTSGLCFLNDLFVVKNYSVVRGNDAQGDDIPFLHPEHIHPQNQCGYGLVQYLMIILPLTNV